jgi:hypothetical protein
MKHTITTYPHLTKADLRCVSGKYGIILPVFSRCEQALTEELWNKNYSEEVCKPFLQDRGIKLF